MFELSRKEKRLNEFVDKIFALRKEIIIFKQCDYKVNNED